MIGEIPINQGVFKSQNQNGVRNNGYAENLVNMLIDIAGGNYDRPTLEEFVTLGSNNIIGIYYFLGLYIAVTFDRKIWTISIDGTVTDITGVPLPGEAIPRFIDDGFKMYIVGGSTPIKWAGGTNVTEALNGGAPAMTHIEYVDGFLLGNRRIDSENNKVLQFADFEATETWNGLNIFSAVSDPDPVQGVAVCQRELFIIGTNTTEIWQNVGSTPVPFARSQVMNYGTRAKYTILVEDNCVFFLDQDCRFIRISGRTPTRMSEQIEEEWSKYVTVNDARTYSFTWNGSIHIMVVFPTERKTWSVDLRNNQWSEWRGFNSDWVRARINCAYYSQEERTTLAGDFQTGKIWKFSETKKTDAGGLFKRLRTFCQRDQGGKIRKSVSMFRINLKRDVAPEYVGAAPETNPTLEVRWKDDGKNWTNFRTISLGEKGNLKSHVTVYRCGIYRTRQYEIQCSDPVELNITSIETDEEVMTS